MNNPNPENHFPTSHPTEAKGRFNPRRDQPTDIPEPVRQANFDQRERHQVPESPAAMLKRMADIESLKRPIVPDSLPEQRRQEVEAAKLAEARRLGFNSVAEAENDFFIDERPGAHLLSSYNRPKPTPQSPSLN